MMADKSNATAAQAVTPSLVPQAAAAQRRMMATLAAELVVMDKAELAELTAMTDAEVLTRVALKAVERIPYTVARRARMRLKGGERFAAMIAEHGGTYTVRETADLLGTTLEGVKKAAQRRRLLAFKHQGQWVFPVWQFTDAGTVLAGLSSVLKALPDGLAERDAVRFFLARTEGQKTATALEMLQKGDKQSRALAERKAQRFMLHLAA